MKKLLCIVLVFMILSLVSCDNQHSDKEKIEEKIFDKYSPIEVLETYQDYARAMDIVSANRNSVKTRFVLRDNIGEEYKVLYVFKGGHRHEPIDYPVEFEEFFANIWNGTPYMRIYLLNESLDACGHEFVANAFYSGHDGSLAYGKTDPDYERYTQYAQHPFLDIYSSEYFEIGDKSQLTIEDSKSYDVEGGYTYKVSYNGREVFTISGCVPIDNELFALIIGNLVSDMN